MRKKSPLDRDCEDCKSCSGEDAKNKENYYRDGAKNEECLKGTKLLASLTGELFERSAACETNNRICSEKATDECRRKALEKCNNNSISGVCPEENVVKLNNKCAEQEEVAKKKCQDENSVCNNELSPLVLTINMMLLSNDLGGECIGVDSVFEKTKLSNNTFVGKEKTLYEYSPCCYDEDWAPGGPKEGSGVVCVKPKEAACRNIVPGDKSSPNKTSPASPCCFGDLITSNCVNMKGYSCYSDPFEHGVVAVEKAFNGKYFEYAHYAKIQALAQEVLGGTKSEEDAAKEAEEIAKELSSKPTKIVGKYSFKNWISDSDVPVLVVFRRPGCPHCEKLSPTINKLVSEYKGRARICTIDTSEVANEELSSKFGIQFVPTLFMYKNDEFKKIEGSIAINALRGIIDKQV